MAEAAEVEIALLGTFQVRVDGREIGPADWPGRRAQELVALLALSRGRRIVRDRVVESLWPHLDALAGAANLRKAAHHARRALGSSDAVVLRAGGVELFPHCSVITDVDTFFAAAEAALDSGEPAVCSVVAASCHGELLPEAPYEAWTQDVRRAVEERLVALLRLAGESERLLALEPTDEAACRALMRTAIADGRRHAAIRAYERLRLALARALGTRPDAETRALYDECTAGVRLGEPAFVGRELELATAMGELARVRRDSGAIAVLVRGTTGIGKSALCRELIRRADEAGWRVLTSVATASGVPYGPVCAALEQLLVGDRSAITALPERTRSVLAELTPLAGSAPRPPGPLTRHQVIAALRRTLAFGGAPPPPTLLLVEDAHLVDEATADVLNQLVAAGGENPLAVMLACRAEWMRTSLPRGIAELAQSSRAHTLQLGPLTTDEVAELVEAALPAPPAADVVAQIVATADGSPFFALELARGAASGALARTVREAIAERFLTLGTPARDKLTELAIANGEFDLPTVLALTGMPEPEAFELLDAALDAGVLVVMGTRYGFRHELVRQALTDGLPPHRRMTLHRDAARRLIESGADAELVAHHFWEGRRLGEAVVWSLAAARHAVMLGAFADALVQLERMLAVDAEHHDGLRLRAEVLDALGDDRAPDAYALAARVIGEPEAQELTARRALAQLKSSDPASALRTLQGCAPRTLVGRLAEALTLSAAAAIGAYADAETASAKAEEAHRLALELGDPGAILDATWAHALAAHAKGELPVRLRDYLRSTAALPEIATRVFDGQLCVTERMLNGGLPNEDIIAFADGLAAEAERLGAARGLAFAHTLRGEAEVLAGKLTAADADFAEGARLHRQIGAAAGEALSMLGRAQVATAVGRRADARAHLADALLLARESEVGHHTLDRIYGAMVEAAEGADAALAVLAEAETSIRGPAETCPTCRIAFLVPATVAAARADDLQRARGYARDCERALAIIALPPGWSAAGAEAFGWLARAEARETDALAHFRTAASGFHAAGQPLDAERCEELAAATR